MQDVLIIAHFTQVPGEVGNGRFDYIANKIDKTKADVEVITTSFSHRTKHQRDITKKQYFELNYKLTLLHEPSYKKNVSLNRFYSHYILGKNLKKYLKNRKIPDVIYCSVPSLNVAKVAATYASKHNIRFIIDIQDLWPEAFKMIFNLPVVSNLIFYPMQRAADYIYSQADTIIAVSQTYVDRALTVNKKCEEAHSIYLGTELMFFDKLVIENEINNKSNDEFWVVYIGTLGHSYDIISVIDALKILKNSGVNNIKFIVMGDGPLKEKFEKYAKEQDVHTDFTGRLDYSKMLGILKKCDVAMNPIKSGSAASIINKVGDYSAAGLPVINTQESLEYRRIVEEYKIGLNCPNNNPFALSQSLLLLYNDKELRTRMGENNRKVAKMFFNREKTYKKIFDIILDNQNSTNRD